MVLTECLMIFLWIILQYTREGWEGFSQYEVKEHPTVMKKESKDSGNRNRNNIYNLNCMKCNSKAICITLLMLHTRLTVHWLD